MGENEMIEKRVFPPFLSFLSFPYFQIHFFERNLTRFRAYLRKCLPCLRINARSKEQRRIGRRKYGDRFEREREKERRKKERE